jgi:glycosyltransferase involved in cell wall biosynthesis
MKILYLPYNFASTVSYAVAGQNAIGQKARGLIFEKPSVIHDNDGIKFIPIEYHPNRKRKLMSLLKRYYYFIKWVLWADIVHWYCYAGLLRNGFDLKLIRFLKKPGVIEWIGSDIRIPEVEFNDNSYYKEVFNQGYEYNMVESLKNSISIQQKFSAAGFEPVLCADMEQYLDKKLFPSHYRIYQRLMLSDFEPQYPSADKPRPLLVHSPSAPVCKGTKHVLAAIENLKKRYDFDFRLVQNMPRGQALQIIKECDIFLDQFILGAHGLAALEAMAFGKPVVCYIKPVMIQKYPADLPMINANPDNLAEKIEYLLKDASLRHKTGIESRRYVEKYHDARVVAVNLLEIYQKVIARKKNAKSI